MHPLKIDHLRCENIRLPIGLHTIAPRLSWQLNSNGRDIVQVAYRIEVASTTAKLSAGESDLWDSGKVASHESHLVPYAGNPLKSRAIAHWRVTAWDNHGQSATSSEDAFWEMGLREDTDWQADWIRAAELLPN